MQQAIPSWSAKSHLWGVLRAIFTYVYSLSWWYFQFIFPSDISKWNQQNVLQSFSRSRVNTSAWQTIVFEVCSRPRFSIFQLSFLNPSQLSIIWTPYRRSKKLVVVLEFSSRPTDHWFDFELSANLISFQLKFTERISPYAILYSKQTMRILIPNRQALRQLWNRIMISLKKRQKRTSDSGWQARVN